MILVVTYSSPTLFCDAKDDRIAAIVGRPAFSKITNDNHMRKLEFFVDDVEGPLTAHRIKTEAQAAVELLPVWRSPSHWDWDEC